MSRLLRIAIVTTGRFHVCDLARELALRGHEVKFYSWVPPWRTRRFGLPTQCSRWTLPAVAGEFSATRLARGTRLEAVATQRLAEAYDRATARAIEPCDVVIAMSGIGGHAGEAARRRYGAQVWIERTSRHILSQREILAAIPGAKGVTESDVRRELADYSRADMISVPASHCVESFLEAGYTNDRISCIPFGVDLGMFPPTQAPPPEPPTVLMAGTWSLRKGCDILTVAWRRLPGVRLVHVGPVGDCPLPSEPGFVHLPPMDQRKLAGVYAGAHVMAMPSREEGLAMVQPQGLACGLRLVCTTRTGGADLVDYLADPSTIRVVPPDDPEALAEGLAASLRQARGDGGRRDRLGPGRDRLSWAAYAERYESNLIAQGVG